ncbi:MAG: hypothetical protein Q8R71_02325 [Phenylobacterium sp.]|nr:hypothetical protein [Phenylobacterium sp.]
MNRRASFKPAPRRSLLLVLAGLALFLKILIPPGYMAATVQAEGPAFDLVLCTPQGIVTLDAAAPGDHESPASSDEDGARHSPCVFAGHGLSGPAPELTSGERVAFARYADSLLIDREQAIPGRGLAAPPPPARAPPSLQA